MMIVFISWLLYNVKYTLSQGAIFMIEMTIGEVAKRVDVQTSALRYYESVGLLPQPKRVNGRRRYDETIFPQITMIQLAKRAGFTIAEIKLLKDGFQLQTPLSARWRVLAQEKLVELNNRILETEQMMTVLQNGLQCGCLQLEDCVAINEHKK